MSKAFSKLLSFEVFPSSTEPSGAKCCASSPPRHPDKAIKPS